MGAQLDSGDTLSDSLAGHSRYEIIERIGAGGMGDVYKARHRVMNRYVAVKVINRRLVQNGEAVERFRREVHAAAQLSHPNIVSAHDAEQADELHFLVMENVSGVNLSELVKESGPLSINVACDCIRQAAVGLQYAHEQGMVHRDIKPHNLMRDESGTTKILDFGLATLAPMPRDKDDDSANDPELTAAGSIMGTPDYIAPEQAADAHAADIRSDIYSLGATLYFLLAGRPPFVEGTAADKLRLHVDSSPDAIEAVRADIPGELAGVVRRMMNRVPDERFQTPSDVANALSPFTIGAANATTYPKPTGVLTRNRILIGLALAAIFALAGTVYVETDKGTLVVDSPDANVEVTIRQGGREIYIVDTTTGTTAVRLSSGRYEVGIRGDQNAYVLDRDHFELKRGSKSIVTVSHAPQSSPTARN